MKQDDKNPSEAMAYEKGMALFNNGKYRESIEQLNPLTSRFPEALGVVALAYWHLHKDEAALGYLKKYMQDYPNDARSWWLRAEIARKQNDLKSAEEYALKSLKLKPPKIPLIWMGLGEILIYRMNWGMSAKVFKEYLKIDPDNAKAQVLYQRALRYRVSGFFQFLKEWSFCRAILYWIVSLKLIDEMVGLVMKMPLDDRRRTLPINWDDALMIKEPAVQQDGSKHTVSRSTGSAFMQWFKSLQFERPIKKILEVGMGSGEIAALLSEEGYDLLSVTSSEFTRRDRERRGLTALRTDNHAILKPGASFDLVVVHFTLHYCRNPFFSLWEWKRLLRENGYMIVIADLAVDGPAPVMAATEKEVSHWTSEIEAAPEKSPTTKDPFLKHYTFGIHEKVMTLTYWQLRWLFKITKFQMLAEILEDPLCHSLEGVEHVDGSKPARPSKAWNVFFLFQESRRPPAEQTLERPRLLHPQNLKSSDTL